MTATHGFSEGLCVTTCQIRLDLASLLNLIDLPRRGVYSGRDIAFHIFTGHYGFLGYSDGLPKMGDLGLLIVDGTIFIC